MVRIIFGLLIATAAFSMSAEAKLKMPKEPIDYGAPDRGGKVTQNGEHGKYEDPGCKCFDQQDEDNVALGFNTKLDFAKNEDCRAYRFSQLAKTLYMQCHQTEPSAAEIAHVVSVLEKNFREKKTAEANGLDWNKKEAKRHELVHELCMDKKSRKSFHKTWAARREALRAEREKACSNKQQVASQSIGGGGSGTGLVDTGYRAEGSGDAAH